MRNFMLKWVGVAVLLGAIVAAPAPLAAQVAAPPAADAQIEQALRSLQPGLQVAGRSYDPVALSDLMREHKVPAVSIAFIRDGRIAWTGAFGMADPASGRAATTETLFQAASISKPVAAMAALDLVEQGRLSLDRPVNDHLTSWRLPDSPAAEGEPVTLRRLLTHSAGLTVSGFPGYAAGAPLPTTEQVLDGSGPANTDPVRVDIKPGSRWRYSGGGITLAQLMMTDVAGEPFPSLMERLVLRPTGMTRSTYAQPLPAERRGEAAVGHDLEGRPIESNYHSYPEMAAAGLWTTPTDLARWALALTAAYKGEEGGPIAPATAAAMLTPGIGDWGLGVAVKGEGDALQFSHGGSNDGYKANLMMYPNRGEGLIVMTNGDRGAVVAAAVNLAVGRALGWPGAEPRTITPVAISAQERAAILGRYASDNFAVTIGEEGGRLTVTPGQGESFEIVPIGENRFVSPDNGRPVRFERDPTTGRVTGLSSGPLNLRRVEPEPSFAIEGERGR